MAGNQIVQIGTKGGKGKSSQKKKSSKSSKKTKLQPAQRMLRFSMTGGDAGIATTKYIDLPRQVSKVNRRLYRQGRDYHVKKITVTARDGFSPVEPIAGTRVSVSSAPNTWVTREAWKRGFRVWSDMQKQAMHNSGNDLRSTWSDFKIYMNPDSVLPANKINDVIDALGNPYAVGEWVISDFTTPDSTTTADEFYATLMGDHVGAAGSRTSVSLIKSYGESRVTVQADDPNAQPDIADDPLNNVFDYGTTVDEVLQNVIEENDNPPYAINPYPGDNANGEGPAMMQTSVLDNGRAVLGGFNAICGLIAITTESATPSLVLDVLVELSPGKYRGVQAEAI